MTGTTPYTTTIDTPVGPFTVVADGDDAVVASGFTADVEELLSLVHPALRPAETPIPRAGPGPATEAATRYFAGDCAALDAVAVRQRSGGGFMAGAWTALRTVPPGEPVSYAALAALAGRPTAVRAAAQACARNAVALFVPCHRVLRGDGSVGGYRWGAEAKRWLLDHEASHRSIPT